MNVVECYYCGESIKFKSTPKINQYITCPFCKSVLQVFSVSPLIIHPVEDDWENETEMRSYRQYRKNGSFQSRHSNIDIDDVLEDANLKSNRNDTGRRANEQKKRHKHKINLNIEMED